MRRFYRLGSLFLVLLLLTACGTDAKPAMEVLEVPAFSLPETADAEPVSAPAVVTEGRAPAEDYDLPPSPAAAQEKPRYNMERWASGGVIELLAEAPEADAAFYGLPYSQDAQETALIRWGDSLAEFDWYFATPRMFPPRMAAMDLDGDGEHELAVLRQRHRGLRLRPARAGEKPGRDSDRLRHAGEPLAGAGPASAAIRPDRRQKLPDSGP